MPQVGLPVPWIKQEELFGCGPADAQMILSALGVAGPATPPSWQSQLWLYIQSVTNETRPYNAGPGTPYAPSFPDQLCERCPNGPWDCWATSPDALERTLNNKQNVGLYAVTPHSTEEDATLGLMVTLDQLLPGVALVFGRQHWVVVESYLHSEPGFTLVRGRKLNGVYIRNSQNQGIHYISWRKWKDDYLRFIPCGRYKNTMIILDAIKRNVPGVTPTPPAAPTNIRVNR
jgi:hypothetical protein